MSLYYFLLTLLAVAFSAVGQVFFKKTALRINASNSASTIEPFFAFQLIQEYFFWIAVLFYGLATLGWVYVLQHVPLSRAYPFMAMGYIIIPVLSWYLFQEALTWRYFSGVSCIIIGIVVIGLE